MVDKRLIDVIAFDGQDWREYNSQLCAYGFWSEYFWAKAKRKGFGGTVPNGRKVRVRGWNCMDEEDPTRMVQDLLFDANDILKCNRKYECGYNPSLDYMDWFPPSLCIHLIRLYSRKGGTVYDPCAGGCMLGEIAGMMGRRFLGTDINAEILVDNKRHAAHLFGLLGQDKVKPLCKEVLLPEWRTGNLLTCSEEVKDMELVITIPPIIKESKGNEELVINGLVEFWTIAAEQIYKTLNRGGIAIILIPEERSGDYGLIDLAGAVCSMMKKLGAIYLNTLTFCRLPSMRSAGALFEKRHILTNATKRFYIFCKGYPLILNAGMV